MSLIPQVDDSMEQIFIRAFTALREDSWPKLSKVFTALGYTQDMINAYFVENTTEHIGKRGVYVEARLVCRGEFASKAAELGIHGNGKECVFETSAKAVAILHGIRYDSKFKAWGAAYNKLKHGTRPRHVD